MAVVLNLGAGGVTAASDVVLGEHIQRVKVTFGAVDTATLVTAGTPLPVDTELPAAITLADNVANPAAPAVGAYLLVFDGVTWDRAPGTSTDGVLVNLGANNDVTVTSGTVTANAGTGTFTVGGSVSVAGAVDTELPAAVVLSDNTVNPTVPGVGAFTMVFDGITWDRAPGTTVDGLLVNLGANNDVTVTSGTVTANAGTGTFTVGGSVGITGAVDTELPAAVVLAENMANPTVPGVGAFPMLFDGVTWDRMPGTSVDGVLVNLGVNNDITGTVTANAGAGTFTVAGSVSIAGAVDTELPAATALADDTVTPTVPGVGAFAMVFDGTTWDRARGTSADGMLVNLGANNDITVTSGTVTANLAAGVNNIGDVDVADVVPGTGATNLGKAEDAPHATGHTGVMVLGVRQDVDGTPVSLDGDYQAFQFDAAGNVKVAIKAGAGSGGTAMTDDAAFTPGSTSFTPAGGTFRTVRDLVDDNDAGAFAMTQRRAILAALETPNGDSAMDETNDAVRVNVVAGAGSGGTAMTDDAAFTPGATAFTPAGGTFRSVRDLVDDNDGGAFAMTQRRAILSAIETPAGDSAMDDTNDAVRVNVVAGSGGGVSHTDDAVFTPGTSAVVPAAGLFDDTLPDSVDEGDAGILRMSANRNLYVRIRDNAGNERGLNIDASGNANITGTVTANAGTGTFTVGGTVTANAGTGTFIVGDGGGSLTIDGSVSVTGAVDTELPAAVALADDTANPTVPGVSAFAMVFDGTTWDRARGTSVDGVLVNLGANNDVTVTSGTVTANAGTGTFTVGGSVSVTGAVDTELPAAAALADNTANPTTTSVGALAMLFDGTTWDRAPGTSVDGLLVNLGANNDVTVTSGTVTANAGTGTFTVGGINAHDAAVTGNPLRIGARANLNEPTAVSADNDAVELWADRLGRLVVVAGHSNTEPPVTINATASGDTTVIAAPGASLSLYVQRGSLHNRGASTNVVSLRDGTAGTIRWRAELAADGGGSIFDFGDLGWKLTANTLLATNLTATGDVDVNITAHYIAA